MSQEVERKFLLKNDSYRSVVIEEFRIVQGYLSSVPERAVRIRIRGDRGFLTVKGIGSESGASRFEWEIEIPLEDAQDLLEICEPGVIDKTRHLVNYAGRTFEIDEFHGDNSGLVLAEVELDSEGQSFKKPAWLGREITGDDRYYNAQLIKHPYGEWND